MAIAAPMKIDVPADQEHLLLARLDHSALTNHEDLASEYLSGSEWEEWSENRHPERRAEWLGVRICLKTMLCGAAVIAGPKQVMVKKSERGRPQLFQQDNRPFPGDCSLSHAQSWSVVAWTGQSGRRVGVDVEKVSRRLERVRGAFHSAEDRAVLERPLLEQLTIWWCLKESFSKVVGLGLGAGLSEIACRETSPGRHRMRHETGCEMTGGHVCLGEFVVAWCDSSMDSSCGSVSFTTN